MWSSGNTVKGNFRVTSPRLPSFMAIALVWHREQYDEVRCWRKVCGYCGIVKVGGYLWLYIQGLKIKFQDCASKTGKKVSKKNNKFFLFKIHPVGVDTTLGACFQASECSFEVRLWNSLQSSGYIPVGISSNRCPLTSNFSLWNAK